MEDEPLVDIAQACRLCLMNENDPNMLDIDEPILKTIQTCGIKIFEISELPMRICENCHSILQFILKFHKMCENSVAYLRETYAQTEVLEIVPKQDPDEDIVDALSDDYSAEILTSDEIHEEVITEIAEASSPQAAPHVVEDLTQEQLPNEDDVGHAEYIYDHDNDEEQPEEKVKIDQIEYEQLETVHDDDETEEVLWVATDRKQKSEEDDDLTVYILDEDKHQLREENKIVKEGQTLLRPKNSQLLLKQQSAESTITIKIYTCEICGNTYRKQGALESHRRRHRNAKPYECEICSESFDYNFKLERHMRKHTGARPFECEFCNRRFVDRSTMSRHTKIHTNERAYSCTMCGKSFTYYSVLKTHIMSHTGEKPYTCGICDKGFHRASDLKNHLETLQHRKDPRVPELLLNIKRKDEVTLHGFT